MSKALILIVQSIVYLKCGVNKLYFISSSALCSSMATQPSCLQEKHEVFGRPDICYHGDDDTGEEHDMVTSFVCVSAC